MKRGTLILTGAALSLVLGAAAFGFSVVGQRQASPISPPQADLATVERTLDDACSSATTYERLKTKLFDVALDVGDVDPAKLDLLAGSTVVRMEDPILKAKDEELGVTVCAGRFVVELPPGAEKAFDGKRRLEAEIEYAAQVAADGSGIVYQLRGAEPITYRLAAFDLQGLPPLKPVEVMPALAEAEPILMPSELVPAALANVPPVAEAKRVPEVAVAADKADPVKMEKPAVIRAPTVLKADAAKTEAKSKLAVKKVEVASKAEKAKPSAKPTPSKEAKPVAAAKPKSKAEVKVAAVKKVGKAAAKQALAKPKAAKAQVKAAKSDAKPAFKPKPPVRTAAAEPKAAPKLVKAPPPKPAVKVVRAAPIKPMVKKAAQPIRTASRDIACGPGRPLSERLMCANPSLATKERRMLGVYHAALDNADGATRRVLQETAGDFQAYRNNCRTEGCLSGAFDDRMAEIRDILADMR